jgi:hypothetical protein
VNGFEEPALFDEPQRADILTELPALPPRPVWRRHRGGFGLFCGYCLRLAQQRYPDQWLTMAIRRPTWERVGTDAAQLLLCDIHADGFATERSPK